MDKKRRFHRKRKVRWSSKKKCWVVTIGRNLTPANKLADRDWYFAGHLSEEEATRLANEKAQQWEVICKNWHRTDQSLLEAFGEPFPDEPRWNANPGGKTPRVMDPATVKQLRGEDDVAEDVIIEAMADYTMKAFIDFYEEHRGDELQDRLFRGTSLSKLVKQMRRATDFFPDDVPARKLIAKHFRDAKAGMAKAKLGRRSQSNLLSAAVELLEFIYAEYIGGVGLPAGLRDAIGVKQSKATKVEVYTHDQLKAFLKATKGMLSQLDIMLALNCGMYPQDIGRLLLGEIDFSDESVFWDREKEPNNDFRLHHILWPETLLLVRRWLNDGSVLSQPVLDYRYGKANATLLNPRELAFLDGGKPRYWTMPSGSEKNRVSDLLRKQIRGVTFVPLRKTANNEFEDLIEKSDSADSALGAGELSDRFLGHGTDALRKVYRQFKKGAYVTMNRYLAKLGAHLRSEGVFVDVV